ncbi:MAG: hypothetical protein J6336_04835 [Kiritimatiellae bacterium]|nr:hypothetical protein [Kiritimatiellia bacterium]
MRILFHYTIILVGTIILSAFSESQPTFFDGPTPVEAVPIEEHPTVDSLVERLTEGQALFKWGFPQFIEFLKRQRPTRRMFHRAIWRVIKNYETNQPTESAPQWVINRYAIDMGGALTLLALCADIRDRDLFRNIYMDTNKPLKLRTQAYFAHLVSAPDPEFPTVIEALMDQSRFSWEDRMWMYHEIGHAFSFASFSRRNIYAGPFRHIVWRENHIYNFLECDHLMKAFDPCYAKSGERVWLIDKFRNAPQEDGVDREGWLPTLDKALDESTNLTAEMKAPYFVQLDTYPPFISYEESILGKKPNPHRALLWVGGGVVLASACAVCARRMTK